MNKRKVVFIAVFLIILLVGTTSAALVVTSMNRRFEAMAGGTLNVTNSIIISDAYFGASGGFDVSVIDSPGLGTSSSNPVYFGAGFLATPSLTMGNWILIITLNTTASTPANSTFEVNIWMHAIGKSYNYTLYVATGSTVQPNAMIMCQFDLGPTLITPLAYRMTVRKL